MKTDPSIYEFLATGAEAFRVLTGGVTLSGTYRFGSLTLKGVERRLDGIYEPDGHDAPVYLIEFQAQYAAAAWYNLLTKLGLYGEAHPQCAVRGILIFLRAGDDPGRPPAAGRRAAAVHGILPGRCSASVAGARAGQPLRCGICPAHNPAR